MSSTPRGELAMTRPGVIDIVKRTLFNPATRQKLLAFASLLALMAFFSVASPNFLQADNMVSILQSTAVNEIGRAHV